MAHKAVGDVDASARAYRRASAGRGDLVSVVVDAASNHCAQVSGAGDCAVLVDSQSTSTKASSHAV